MSQISSRHPVNPSSKTFARQQQRWILIALSGLSLVAMLRPMLVPRQPPLPQLPAGMDLPAGWRLRSSTAVIQPQPALPPWRMVALGPTVEWERTSGERMLLTPMASWNAKQLDPAVAVRGISSLSLTRPRHVSIGRSGSEFATSPSSAAKAASAPVSALYQACLTASGKAAHTAKQIGYILPSQNQAFFQQPLRNILSMLFPAQPTSANCVLLTTTAADQLTDPEAANQMLTHLSNQIAWPGRPSLPSR